MRLAVIDVMPGVRTLEARGSYGAKRVDHVGVRDIASGMTAATVVYANANTPPLAPGMELEGELAGADAFDSSRQKLRITTGPHHTVAQTAPPAGWSAPAPAPGASPPVAPAQAPTSRRIERQHSQEMALRYLTLAHATRDLHVPLTLELVAAITSTFERDLSIAPPPPRDLPPPITTPEPFDPTPEEYQ